MIIDKKFWSSKLFTIIIVLGILWGGLLFKFSREQLYFLIWITGAVGYSQYAEKKNIKMFKNAWSFKGRIRRLEFGLSFLTIIFFTLYINENTHFMFGEGFAYLDLALIPIAWFQYSQGAKRCHDMGKSGWWQLIPFYVFVMLSVDGTRGINEYGASPKEVQ